MSTNKVEGWVFVPGIRRRLFPKLPWMPATQSPTRFELGQHWDRLYHWRLVAVDGEVIARSAHGYAQKGDCLIAIGLVKLATNDLIRDIGKLDPTQEA